MNIITRILAWIVSNASFTSGISNPTRTFKLVFLGGRVSFARGFHGNCTRGLFIHWGGSFGNMPRMRTVTIRTGLHTETSLYFRFGQPRYERQIGGPLVMVGRMWGIDVNSVHILNLYKRVFGKVSRFGFEYRWNESGYQTWETLHFLGHEIALDI
jgi:hypothetical protein